MDHRNIRKLVADLGTNCAPLVAGMMLLVITRSKCVSVNKSTAPSGGLRTTTSYPATSSERATMPDHRLIVEDQNAGRRDLRPSAGAVFIGIHFGALDPTDEPGEAKREGTTLSNLPVLAR